MKLKLSFLNILLIVLVLLVSTSVFAFWGGSESNSDIKEDEKNINEVILNNDGLIFRINSEASTVSEFINEQGISVSDNDSITPSVEAKIFSGSRIIILRAKKITITADGEEIESYTLHKIIKNAILENSLVLSDVDIVHPSRSSLVHNGIEIKITRVNIEEKIVKKDIDFKIISKEDNKLGWRDKKIEQKGEKGIREIKYEITYHNGKEINREILESNIIKEPINEVVIQGTYVKLGKAHKGDASYYASSWGTMNASRSILKGGYAKVTNLDNGKSIIVKINDYGPLSSGRIIDLAYASFAKIGDPGQGILHNVKVEEVLN